jgi:hypothetical protein
MIKGPTDQEIEEERVLTYLATALTNQAIAEETVRYRQARQKMTKEEKAAERTLAEPARKLAAQYDAALAAKLLELAQADKIPADEFAGQLRTWAAAMAAHLEAGTDHGSQPTVADIRAKFQKLSRDAGKLMKSLAHLPVEAYAGLGHAVSDGDDLTEYQVKAEAQAYIGKSILQLDELRHATISAAEDCDGTDTKDGPKNRRQDVRRLAVRELGLAWWMFTNKKPTRQVRGTDHSDKGKNYGRFQEFVVMALEPLYGEKEARSGIDAVIKDLVADMEKTPQSNTSRFFHVETRA